MKAFSQKFHQGFTLIEVIVSVFVFLIIMTAVTNTFTSGFSSYKNTKIAQKNVEDAQFALNLMAKELRTSTVVSSGSAIPQPVITFYDYSQSLCLRYRIDTSNNLQRGSISVLASDIASDCTTGVPDASFGMQNMITENINYGRFLITPSVAGATPRAGRVTVMLDINKSGTSQHAYIQTTVSLRDYGFVGP